MSEERWCWCVSKQVQQYYSGGSFSGKCCQCLVPASTNKHNTNTTNTHLCVHVQQAPGLGLCWHHRASAASSGAPRVQIDAASQPVIGHVLDRHIAALAAGRCGIRSCCLCSTCCSECHKRAQQQEHDQL